MNRIIHKNFNCRYLREPSRLMGVHRIPEDSDSSKAGVGNISAFRRLQETMESA